MYNPHTVVIGTGRVAQSLLRSLHESYVPILRLQGRNEAQRKALAERWEFHRDSPIGDPIPTECNLVLIAVSDAALPEVVEQLQPLRKPGRIFAHLSGSTDLSVLSPLGEEIGVFYPLQMFTEEPGSFHEVPLFLEGEGEAYAHLENLAYIFTSQVYRMNSAQRRRLHLSAVFAVNFPNLLYRLAEEQLADTEADFSVFETILQEQMRRVKELGPARSQTGPALRGDRATLQTHLQLLDGQPEQATLYRLLSQMINPELSFE